MTMFVLKKIIEKLKKKKVKKPVLEILLKKRNDKYYSILI